MEVSRLRLMASARQGGQRTEFRNWEPARRVGVRRTIADFEIVGPVTVPAGDGNSSVKDFMAGTVARPKRRINKMRKLALKSDGFTLIEVIMIIVIVSVFMAAIGKPLLSSLR